jgi:hypothetical protein
VSIFDVESEMFILGHFKLDVLAKHQNDDKSKSRVKQLWIYTADGVQTKYTDILYCLCSLAMCFEN